MLRELIFNLKTKQCYFTGSNINGEVELVNASSHKKEGFIHESNLKNFEVIKEDVPLNIPAYPDEKNYNVCQYLCCNAITNGEKFCHNHIYPKLTTKAEGLSIQCDFCRERLTELGGLLFGSPDKESKVIKKHICQDCFNKLTTKAELDKEICSHFSKSVIKYPEKMKFNESSGVCSQCGHHFTAYERGYNFAINEIKRLNGEE